LSNPSAFRRCMDINFLSAVSMCQHFLPLLRRARGRIINMSSLAGGSVPMPLFGAYGASKAALKVFSEVMRQELAPWGVMVSVIQPAGFRTSEFYCQIWVRNSKNLLLQLHRSCFILNDGLEIIPELTDLQEFRSSLEPTTSCSGFILQHLPVNKVKCAIFKAQFLSQTIVSGCTTRINIKRNKNKQNKIHQ
uniref:Hydroxysteroid (17-beta) dehydrogenase 2 n=1 Tax=Acanthochromis polyacanthus TaxID=80966 RepID=A0A3Q1ECH6_9TELE